MKRLSCLLGNHQYKMEDMIFEHTATDYECGIGYFRATNTCVHCGKKLTTIVELPIQKWLYNSEKEVDDGEMDRRKRPS